MYTRLAKSEDLKRIREIYKGKLKHMIIVSGDMHKEAIKKGLMYVYDNGTIWGYLRVKRISGALQIEEILLSNMLNFPDESIPIKDMIEHVISLRYNIVASEKMGPIIEKTINQMPMERYNGKTCIRYIQ